MGRKKNIPIDVPTSAAQEGQGQPTGWAGSLKPAGLRSSPRCLHQQPVQGHNLRGLPGLGKRSK